MKRLVSNSETFRAGLLAVFVAAGFPSLLTAQTASLSVGTGSALSGGTTAIGVSFVAAGGAQASALQFQLDYPATSIAAVTADAGSVAVAAGKSVRCSSQPGRMNCVVVGPNQNILGSGLLATLAITVAPSAPVGAATLALSGFVVTDNAGRGIATTAPTAGTLVVTAPALPQVSALNCSPLSVLGPANVACTVSLTATAGAGGQLVGLSSSNANVGVPAWVTVPAGQLAAGFGVTVGAVNDAQTAVVTASANGSSRTQALSLLAPPRYTLSGNAGSAGALVSLSGTSVGTTIADASGNYLFANLLNGSYTVSPSRSGFTFTPAIRAVTINGANLSAVNFSAVANNNWMITGSLGLAGAGATVLLSGAASATTTANESGAFTFTGLANGTYLVTPTRSGVVFSPASAGVSIQGANANVVFGAQPQQSFTISGSLGVSSVFVGLSGGASLVTVTDANGRYQFPGLSNGSYVVTPFGSNSRGFTPASRSVTVSGGDQVNVDFQLRQGTLSIRGSLGAAGAGASVSLSGPSSAVVTADGLGDYLFSNLGAGTYLITPAKAGVVFSPVSQSVTLGTTSLTGINFSSQAQTWSISGALSNLGSGALVAVTGATNRTVSADGAGNYSVGSLANGTYTITPSKFGVLFSPGSRTVTVNGADVAGVSFAAQNQTYSLSGALGVTGSGAVVNLTGATSATATADGAGNYSFANLPNGAFTVTPSKSGITFTPVSRAVTISGANLTGVNFTAQLPVTYSISGSAGAGGGSAIVELSGAQTAVTQADPAGNYSFPGLSNGTYTLRMTKPGFVFTPATQTVTVNGANLTGVNFTPQANLYSIGGTIPGGGPTVITVAGPVNLAVTLDSRGRYVASGLPPGSYWVTPSSAGRVFTPAQQLVVLTSVSLTSVNFVATSQAGLSAEKSRGEGLALVNLASDYVGEACSPGAVAALVGSAVPEGEGRVWVHGEVAPVTRWRAGRAEFQCPAVEAGTPLEIRLEDASGQRLGMVNTVMQESAPGIFTREGSTEVLAWSSTIGGLVTERARVRGGDILTIFATGLGASRERLPSGVDAPTDRLMELRTQVRVVVAGQALEPWFAGRAPGTLGVDQINFQLPEELPEGEEWLTLHLEVRGGHPIAPVSNTVRIPIAVGPGR